MTAVALPVCIHMGSVFAGCRGAVVTARAGADDTRVIEGAGGPGHGGMAILTRPGGRNMGRRLAGGVHIVVAAFASRNDAGMVEPHVQPGGIGDMAIITRGVGLDMIDRLAGGGIAIVTAGTGARYHGVIEIDLQPAVGGGMTSLAGGRRGHVGGMLAGRLHPVMA